MLPLKDSSRDCKNTVASESFNFLTMSRSGLSSVQVRMAGSGSRASTLTWGASLRPIGDAGSWDLLKRLFSFVFASQSGVGRPWRVYWEKVEGNIDTRVLFPEVVSGHSRLHEISDLSLAWKAAECGRKRLLNVMGRSLGKFEAASR